MSKDKFINLLKRLNIEISEGEQDDVKKANVFPRLLFFDFLWDFQIASSDIYNTEVTYQISYFSRSPRDEKLISLLRIFLENGIIMSQVKKEFIENGSYWHYYFSVEIKEKII